MTPFEQALTAARRGQYRSAAAELSTLGGDTSEDPRVLDLLARVHAQQGEFAQADACWSRLQSLDPANEEAARGRRRIAALQAKRMRPSLWPITVTVMAVTALAAAAATAGILLPAQQQPAPAPAPDLSAVTAGQAKLASELETLRARLTETPLIDRIRKSLTSPEFAVVRQGDALLVTFVNPLFARDARLTPPGTTALEALATQLQPFSADMFLTITGHTDNRARSPLDLGFARARTAAEALAAAIPIRAITTTSAGATPLHPNTPQASRAKNNTVTVLITPAQGTNP